MILLQVLPVINDPVFRAVGAIASSLLNTMMGYWAESFLVVLPLIGIYLFFKKDRDVFSYAFAVVALLVIAEILKDIFMEPRPCTVSSLSWINHVGCESGFSFPSNHATVLTGLFVFMKQYRRLQALYVIWMLVTLFGRVYLGQHYFTDVVAGAVLSIVIGAIIYMKRQSINKTLGGIFFSVVKPLPFIKDF